MSNYEHCRKCGDRHFYEDLNDEGYCVSCNPLPFIEDLRERVEQLEQEVRLLKEERESESRED